MNKVFFSSNYDIWQTLPDLFQMLDNEFHFEVDLCASSDYHLKDKYYTFDNSCFECDLQFTSIFCNPPYSKYNYLKKCKL